MTAPAPLNRLFISWEQLERDAKALAAKLQSEKKWKGIVAVARGGLVPATIIARALDIILFETVIMSGYKLGSGAHEGQAEPKIIKAPVDVGDGEGWLVIDDLAATGRTGKVLHQLMPKAHFAAIYVKPTGKASIDSYLTEISQDTWIYLPWYDELQFKHPISLTTV